MSKKETVLVILGILLIIFLMAVNVYIGEKAFNRCVSSGRPEYVCNDVRK